MNARTPSSAGFTIYELVIAVGMAAVGLMAVTSSLATNADMVDDARARQRAEAAHRRNITAIARVLREVDIQTLGGFDGSGNATTPSFSRVTGADLDDLTYVGEESLEWSPSPLAVDGVKEPGAVYLVRGEQRTLVADRVPSGGFRLVREGQNLVIHMTTYYVTSTSHLAYRTSHSVVSVRN